MTLLRFSVTNFRSIRDRQELSLVASSALKDDTGGLITPDGSNLAALPAAIIYGANASGKSNVISAFSFFRTEILRSHVDNDPESAIDRTPFLLNKHNRSPTIIECDFIVDKVHYNYGFSANDNEFESEWLYSYETKRRTMLFERNFSSFEFGRSLRGRNKLISELNRRNSLFLSTAAQNDHPILSKLSRFFRLMGADLFIQISSSIASAQILNIGLDKRVLSFINSLDGDIVDFRKKDKKVTQEMKNFGKFVTDYLSDKVSEKLNLDDWESYSEIELAHKSKSGRNVFFHLDEESDGTRRMLTMLTEAFRCLDTGVPMFVDELDSSLHTHACEQIVALFSTKATNPNGAQLIATTHDTNLLAAPMLRRDQVWFCEKQPGGATELYPLTDIRTRKGDNFEKGYLEGRYGAVPLSGRLKLR